MRVRDIAKGLPLLHTNYIVLDIDTFLVKGEYRTEEEIRTNALRCLDQLQRSYNFVSLRAEVKEDKPLSTVTNFFANQTNKVRTSIGRLIIAPYENWGKVLEEFHSPLVYYGTPSNEAVKLVLSDKKLLSFSSNHITMDILLNQYANYIDKKIELDERKKIINGLKRSSDRKKLLSRERANAFLRKFE